MTAKRYVLDEGLIYDNGMEMEDVVDVLNEYDVTCKELEREVKLLSEFILSKDYTLDDFNKYLCSKWSDVE